MGMPHSMEASPSTIDGTVLKESVDLDILGVTFDSKLAFERFPEQLLKDLVY